jgi:hypothetical protein
MDLVTEFAFIVLAFREGVALAPCLLLGHEPATASGMQEQCRAEASVASHYRHSVI